MGEIGRIAEAVKRLAKAVAMSSTPLVSIPLWLENGVDQWAAESKQRRQPVLLLRELQARRRIECRTESSDGQSQQNGPYVQARQHSAESAQAHAGRTPLAGFCGEVCALPNTD